ncbi:hypothetical protein BT69DRAFT_1214373 [Atractiella rhizophila]|nr:hypothetical protein BT69DRAFT_1214373 [Atractiella rhizophila]
MKKSRKKARKSAPSRLQETDTVSTPSAPPQLDSASPSSSTSFRSRVQHIVPGATLKTYQLSGVEWLLSLFENGLNGVLADEMGLGKTLQTIAFIAYLRDRGINGPFLVVCPLSTLGNWVSEFARFAPSLHVVKYHGTPAEREEMRRKWKSLKDNDVWPVIVTSYEMTMRDRKFLTGPHRRYQYIVVDESHRLKNMNCKLIRELKTYNSENRLLLTGTPLQNNLAELWSLLNYILPQIFDDLDNFTSWFNFTEEENDEKGGDGTEEAKEEKTDVLNAKQSEAVVEQLHVILKPFLLRRVKAEVERDIPRKKEYLLSCPLTQQQKTLYDAVLKGQIRDVLLHSKLDEGATEISPPKTPNASTVSIASSDTESPSVSGSRPVRRGRGKKRLYRENDFEGLSEKAFLRQLNKEIDEKEALARVERGNEEERRKEYDLKKAKKEINNLKLQNVVMQLRKICNHPWLMDWPKDPDTGLPSMSDDLVNASGKMFLLDRLLERLFAQNHKVLLFSQFTSMLDVIEDWAVEIKGWPAPARIDGSSKQDERVEEMRRFTEGQGEGDPKLFLLSTRAGGVGINLTAADTVILFDSDWNPTVDMQAIDRSHRIGQTSPVLVFRLVCGSTVESRMLKKAGLKRKLGQMVIEKGNFKVPGEQQDRLAYQVDEEDILGLNDIKLADKQTVVMTDEELDLLLDRSDAAFDRAKSWRVDGAKSGIEVFESDAGMNATLGTVAS